MRIVFADVTGMEFYLSAPMKETRSTTLDKTVLSFYVDDTNPYVAPPGAFTTFLDFVAAEGVAGELSVILGYDWDGHGHMGQPLADVQGAYIEQVQRVWLRGRYALRAVYASRAV